MVDSAVNWLFVDLNSYFASIEQELCPELRGQPIAIVPIRVEAQTGCCIAVSYQAKAYAAHHIGVCVFASTNGTPLAVSQCLSNSVSFVMNKSRKGKEAIACWRSI
jgi:DNA polymerase-4